ncbi:MAG: amino acid permease [Gemmatimonadetes bacterium]|nr:amino acid permease [Gemmatimonadota bacterium]
MNAPRRKFGFWLATALVVGNIIGSAIFMLPAGLAAFGWNAVSAWVITFVGALCLAWVFAELARHLPTAGGSFGFMRLGVGEGAAFVGAWGYMVSVWAANAGITIAGISYLTRLVPGLTATPWASPAAAIGAIWLLTWINMRGLHAAGGVQLVTSIVKLLPFVAVIGLAVWRLAVSGGALLPPVHAGSFTFAGASGAVGLTLYAMLGLESATVPADAVENPEVIVPRATMVGTGLSAVVSIMATCAVALMLPADVVASSKAPVSDFIAASWGDIAGGFVALCAVISCFGCLNGWLLIGGELPVAMVKAGTLPPWFGKLNASGAPAQALVLSAVLTTLLTLMAYTKTGVGAYNFAILIATATNLVLYLFCAIGVVRFMRDGRVPRSAALVVCTGIALLFILWAFYGSGWESLAWGGALVVAGWPVYLVARRSARSTAGA